MSSVLKKAIEPLRQKIGRFVAAPWEKRLARLEAATKEYQLKNSLIYKAAAMVTADKIEGDYLEFGVYSGNSFIASFKAIEERFRIATSPNDWSTEQDYSDRHALWKKMRFFAFDSFAGLPKPEATDAVSRDFVQGKFACSEGDFRKHITTAGVPTERVTTIPGWFNDTLNEGTRARHNLQSAAIVWVDCDLYESTKPVLKFITPLLVDGTIIIFDDWFNFKGNPTLGEQRACREWLATNPGWVLTEYQREGPWRNSFIAHPTK